MSEQNVALGLRLDNHQAVVSSLDVARVFERQHYNVLRDIREAQEKMPESLRTSFFLSTVCLDAYGRSQPAFDLTRDGWVLLTFGYTGQKAMDFKIAYIQAFNAMEEQLRQAQASHPPKALPNPVELYKLLPPHPVRHPDDRLTLRAAKVLAEHPAWQDVLAYLRGDTKNLLMLLKPAPADRPAADPGQFPRRAQFGDVSGARMWFCKFEFDVPTAKLESAMLYVAMTAERRLSGAAWEPQAQTAGAPAVDLESKSSHATCR